MKGLQAFYPNEQTLARDREESGHARDLRRVPALPLEIFLDVRSEATDYDRIILKTDAAIQVDKFNSLRVPRGLVWPEVNDELGQPVKHLKLHMVSHKTCGGADYSRIIKRSSCPESHCRPPPSTIPRYTAL